VSLLIPPQTYAELRKARGAFFTPPELCDYIVEWAVRSPGDEVLEPSCGEAAFLLSAGARLKALAERYDTTPGAVAVAWTLRNPSVDGAIVGFRRPDQVDPILPAASLQLTDEDLAEIEGGAR